MLRKETIGDSHNFFFLVSGALFLSVRRWREFRNSMSVSCVGVHLSATGGTLAQRGIAFYLVVSSFINQSRLVLALLKMSL